jgi:putative oxidoreductase
MAGAVAVSAPAGFFAMSGGFEYPAFLGYSAAGIGLTGPGRYSLDHLTCHVVDRPWVVAVAFSVSAAAACVVLSRRAEVLESRARTADGPSDAAG